MSESTAAGKAGSPRDGATGYREIRYEYSDELPGLLADWGVTLLVSTYQAGKLAVISSQGEELKVELTSFERPMGVAVEPQRLAVGTRDQVWFLDNAPEIAGSLEPVASRDACFLARAAHVTGEIQGHEMAWSGGRLWIVNTLFSCLCTLDGRHSFVPRWQPPFITALAPQDRCHLNGLAMSEGRPRYVTVLSESDEPAGWRPTKASSGCVVDVLSGQTLVRGLAMPHSPRLADGRLWLLNSGAGQLVEVDTELGGVDVVEKLPGYTRGLDVFGNFALVGLSRIRETSTFDGVPIAAYRDQLRCGVAIVDLETGRSIARFEFKSGVEEIFDVRVLPARFPKLIGPRAHQEGQEPIWLVPPLQ